MQRERDETKMFASLSFLAVPVPYGSSRVRDGSSRVRALTHVPAVTRAAGNNARSLTRKILHMFFYFKVLLDDNLFLFLF